MVSNGSNLRQSSILLFCSLYLVFLSLATVLLLIFSFLTKVPPVVWHFFYYKFALSMHLSPDCLILNHLSLSFWLKNWTEMMIFSGQLWLLLVLTLWGLLHYMSFLYLSLYKYETVKQNAYLEDNEESFTCYIFFLNIDFERGF